MADGARLGIDSAVLWPDRKVSSRATFLVFVRRFRPGNSPSRPSGLTRLFIQQPGDVSYD
jgi:hypothetical protein